MNAALLLAVAVVAAVVAEALDRTGRLPPGVSATGPFLTVSSTRGRSLLDRLARPRRAWRAVGSLGVAVVAVGAAGALAAVLFAGYAAVTSPDASPVSTPASALVIPGVNPFLPLSAAPAILLAVVVGLVVHEGAHGVYCRVADVPVDSVGVVLLAVIPAGAFVQPDRDADPTEDPAGWARLFAAGPVANLALTAVVLAVLLAVLGSVAAPAGLAVGGVFPGTPADAAGVERGDVVTAVGGRPVTDEADLEAALAASDGTVRVDRRDADPVTVAPAVTVVGAADGAPLAANATVEAVNGTAVRTERDVRAALADRTVARLRTGSGTVTAPMGLLGRVAPDGALAAADAPVGERVVLTRVAGERVLDRDGLDAALAGYDPGDRVGVEAFVGDERRRYAVALGGTDDPVVGVFPTAGVTGMVLDDFGVGAYPAGRYLRALGGGGLPGDDSAPARVFAFLLLPFAGAVGLAPYNFAGFTDPAREVYVVTGPLEPLGGGVFVLANGCFWVAWLSVQLAAFNCLPAYPLDGGRMLRTAAAPLAARLGATDPGRAATLATAGLSALVLCVLLVVLFVPLLT